MRRPVRLARQFGLLLAAAVVAASVGLASAPVALAGTCPNPCLGVGFIDWESASFPADVDSSQGSEVLQGLRSWSVSIGERSQAATNAAISIQSGYPASSLKGPLSASAAVLDQSLGLDLNSTIPVSFSPGFDSARSMSPAVIPAGGGQQSVQVTFRRTDASACVTNIPGLEGCRFEGNLPSGWAGAAIVAVAGPSNLNQKEVFSSNWQPSGANWYLGDPILGKTYTVTVTISLPDLGRSYVYKPFVGLSLDDSGPHGCPGPNELGTKDTCVGPTKRVTRPDATLDGATPGSGVATFSADQSFIWDLGGPRPGTKVSYDALYAPTPTATPTPTAPPTPTATPTPTAAPTRSMTVAPTAVPGGSTGSGGSNGTPPWIALALGGLVVIGLLAAATAVLRSRRRAVRLAATPPNPAPTGSPPAGTPPTDGGTVGPV